MGKFDTNYSKSWEVTYPWIEAVPNDKFSAKCKICKTVFKINGSGVGQIKIHAATKKHDSLTTIISGTSSQSVLFGNANSQIQMTQGNFI